MAGGADPNPLATHLEKDHVSREEFDRVVAELRAAIDALTPPKGPKK